MSRRAVWLAWSVCALCVALAAGSFLLALFNGRTPGEILVDEGIVAIATLAVAFSVVGALVACHRPANPIGWNFCAGESQLAVVVSTLAIAAHFNPLSRRIQSFIDRRYYRGKYDAAKTLEAFSARLRDETNLGTLSGDLAGVVRERLRPAYARLWLCPLARVRGEESEAGCEKILG